MEARTDRELYEFPGFRFDPASGELCGRETVVKLRAQVACVLSLLVERPGQVIDRETLCRALWPDKRIVLFDVSIAAIVRELRRALDDDPKSPRFVETLPRRGYRFVAPVERVTLPFEAGEPVRASLAGRRLPETLLRGGMTLVVLSVLLVVDGSASVEPARSLQTVAEAAPSFRVEAFEPFTQDRASLLVRQIVEEELPAYLVSALPPELRIVEGDGGTRASPDSRAVRVTGGIRVEGDVLVVSTRGLSVRDGRQLWSARYRLDAGDPSLAGREAAARIAAAILDELAPKLLNSPVASPPEPAREAYRQAVTHLQRKTEADAEAAVGLFQRAIDAAPEFADAHAGLADALITWPGPLKTHSLVQRARAAAERALALAPGNAQALRVLGDIHLFNDRDWTRAGERLTRAMQVAPADARIRHSLASWLSARGRHREALREIELARSLDQASVAISLDVMVFHYHARDYPGTLEAARRLATLWPESYATARYSVLSYLAMGDTTGARRAARAELTRWGAEAGRAPRDDSTDAVDDLENYWALTARALERPAMRARVDPVQLATVYTRLGRTHEALTLIETAAGGERHFSYALPYLGVTPALDPLRGDLRFERVLRSAGQAGLFVDDAEP